VIAMMTDIKYLTQSLFNAHANYWISCHESPRHQKRKGGLLGPPGNLEGAGEHLHSTNFLPACSIAYGCLGRASHVRIAVNRLNTQRRSGRRPQRLWENLKYAATICDSFIGTRFFYLVVCSITSAITFASVVSPDVRDGYEPPIYWPTGDTRADDSDPEYLGLTAPVVCWAF